MQTLKELIDQLPPELICVRGERVVKRRMVYAGAGLPISSRGDRGTHPGGNSGDTFQAAGRGEGVHRGNRAILKG